MTDNNVNPFDGFLDRIPEQATYDAVGRAMWQANRPALAIVRCPKEHHTLGRVYDIDGELVLMSRTTTKAFFADGAKRAQMNDIQGSAHVRGKHQHNVFMGCQCGTWDVRLATFWQWLDDLPKGVAELVVPVSASRILSRNGDFAARQEAVERFVGDTPE